MAELKWKFKIQGPSRGIRILAVAAAACLWAGTVSQSLADDVVQPGDLVQIDFICLTAGGEIAAGSDPKAGKSAAAPASVLFRPRNGSRPLSITAGDSGAELFGRPDQRTFEGHVLSGLCRSVVGMQPGHEHTLYLKADARAVMGPGEIVQLSRKRVQPKTMRVSVSEFEEKIGSRPMAGETVIMHTDIPGRVLSVGEAEVIIGFPSEAAEKIMTDFGPAGIHDKGESLELVYDARPGTLVRVGGMVGRISASSEDMMAIDFRHPFGGEILSCKVKVARQNPAAK